MKIKQIGNRTANRCFISAPLGLDLGTLPRVLGEHSIGWGWTEADGDLSSRILRAIESADFVIGVLNGTRADYRVVFELGIAAGMNKPMLLIATSKRSLPIDLKSFSLVKTPLTNYDAVKLHLTAFLAKPTLGAVDSIELRGRESSKLGTKVPEASVHQTGSASELERKIAHLFSKAGGSVVAEPQLDEKASYRPDMLVWLGGEVGDLVDPLVVEVKHTVERSYMHTIEDRLIKFMSASGIRFGLIVTDREVPQRKQQGWPNILWLEALQLESLLKTKTLAAFIREARNRAAHGID